MCKETEIRERILNGDPEAIKCFYETYKNKVYETARHFLRRVPESKKEIEDFVHDFFMDMVGEQKRPKSSIRLFDPGRGSLNTYVGLRLTCTLKNRLRKIKRHNERTISYIEEYSDNLEKEEISDIACILRHIANVTWKLTPDEKVIGDELAGIMRRSIKELKAECQKIFQLRFYSDLSYAETADELDIKPTFRSYPSRI